MSRQFLKITVSTYFTIFIVLNLHLTKVLTYKEILFTFITVIKELKRKSRLRLNCWCICVDICKLWQICQCQCAHSFHGDTD